MKKFILIVILTLFFTTISYGEVDQLVDEFLIEIDNNTFDETSLIEYQMKNNTSPEHQALELFLKGRLGLNAYQYEEAYNHFLESLILLEEDSKLKAEVLYYLSEMEMFFFDITTALDRSFVLRDVSESIGYVKGIIEADQNIAFGYIYYYDYEEGSKYASEAFELSRQENYTIGLSEYYSFLGMVDYYYDDIEQAIEKWQLGLDQLEDVHYTYVIEEPHASFKRSIGEEMILNDRQEEGLVIINNLLLETDPQDTYFRYMLYYSLGDYYSSIDVNQALEYYEQALEMYESSSIIETSYPYEVYIFEALGNTHYSLGNYKRSADYLYSVLNFEYNYEEEAVEKTVAGLDDIKYSEINNKVSLLEQLNLANEERIILSKSLIRVMIISILVLLVAVVIIIFEIRSKSKTEKELYKNSITDSLTQVYNRGKIIDIFSNNLKEDNAVILLDLDDFKNVNDTYGHVAGDNVLIKVTEIIQSSIRETDKLGRYGGEEFLVFLENASKGELAEVAERVRANIELHEWPYEGLKTTASIGVTNCFSKDAETVLHEVDTLMYEAKNSGKNKVACA